MEQKNFSRRSLMKMVSLTMLGTTVSPLLFGAEELTGNTDFFDEAPKAIHLKKGTGKSGTVGGMNLAFKLSKSQTGGHMGCDEMTMEPGFLGAPPHLHRNIDEVCYVLEGTVHILVGDEVFEVNAGDWHLRPKGIVHTFWNAGPAPAKFIEIYLPGGHEEYMMDLANLFTNGNRPKPEALTALANKHDIVFHFDQLQAVMDKYKVHL